MQQLTRMQQLAHMQQQHASSNQHACNNSHACSDTTDSINIVRAAINIRILYIMQPPILLSVAKPRKFNMEDKVLNQCYLQQS